MSNALPTQAGERTGILQLVDGISSEEKTRQIRAGLGDLAGVYGIEVIGSRVEVRFVPDIVGAQQFYQAMKTAGFRAIGFQIAG